MFRRVKHPPNYISLKKPSWQINVHPLHIKSLLLKKKALILYGLVIIITTTILAISHKTKAEIALFYPSSCLGGWENVDKATGLPDIKDGSDPSIFNSDNSAIFKNTSGEIYCGSFKGEIPKDTNPKKFYLSLIWSADDGSVVHPLPEPVTPIDINSNIEVLPKEKEEVDTTSGVDVLVPDVLEGNPDSTTDTPLDTTAPSTEVAPEIIAPPSDAPQSLFFNSANIAYAAEDETSIPTPEVTPAPEITPSPDVPASDTSGDITAPPDAPAAPTPEITPQPLDVPPDVSANVPPDASPSVVAPDISVDKIPTDLPQNKVLPDTVIPVESIKAEAIDAMSVAEPENFLQISYTLDGVTWAPLSYVNRSNWQNAKFLIPLTTWEDVSKMQISIKSIQSFDQMPVVYLDAMQIDVEYENIVGVIAPSIYHISNMESKTEGLTLVSGGHPPERENIVVRNSNAPINGLVVYDLSSNQMVLSTYSPDSKEYNLDPEFFGVGNFTVVITDDEAMCSDLTLEECLKGDKARGNGNFSIVDKVSEQ